MILTELFQADFITIEDMATLLLLAEDVVNDLKAVRNCRKA